MSKEQRLLEYLRSHPQHADDLISKFLSTQKKKERKRELHSKLFEEYKSGVSLQVIADKQGLTRQRIDQIFAKYFGDEYDTYKVINRLKRKLSDNVETVCEHCGNKFTTKRRVILTKYCSSECLRNNKRTVIYPDFAKGKPIRKEFYTKEQWRELSRIRAHNYYHTHKEEQRARAHANYRKNTVLCGIYQKRNAERRQYGRAITPIPNPKRPEVTKD